ncbi:MAG: hypothetical protein GY795_05820 [Desulfobacterales bacterium]|nr:hypothetical protein [Desulfobacterales bacterium]
MKKFMVLFLFVTTIIGCAQPVRYQEPSVVHQPLNTEVNILIGTWVDTTDTNEYLTFRTGGTWEWTDNQGSKHSRGTWSQSGNSISVRGTDLNGNTFSTTGILGNILYFPQFVEVGTDGTPAAEEFRKL